MEGYEEVVLQAWKEDQNGTAQFRIVQKLKAIKGRLKSWNKDRSPTILQKLEDNLADILVFLAKKR